ncbi:hypothetical protein K438DRAFT_1971095 [Mycena galopus ATCC 62051]|nr:hypothetical protein K438DRAFT_1971095 [Mycena galopus ATCC 62051]
MTKPSTVGEAGCNSGARGSALKMISSSKSPTGEATSGAANTPIFLHQIIVILVVQGLYAYRVWLRYVVAGVVLSGFAIGIVTSYETFTINNWSETGRIAWAIEWSYAATTMIDIIISIAMVYYLRKSQTKQSLLNSRLSTMIQFSLSNGIFTSACSVLCLFTFILMPNTRIFFAFGYILTRPVLHAPPGPHWDLLVLTKETLFPALRTLIETHAALGLKLEGDEATRDVYLT